MKKFLKKNKYIGLAFITIIVFVFLSLPASAQAEGPGVVARVFSWLAADSLLFVSDTISSILGALFGMILYLEAQIIDYIISPTNFPITTAPIVKLGWGITRDLANMFFILILLIIAFATVLRIQSYAIKQLWWKVIAAALLINFSLVIAGFVIDFTNVLTTFFLKQITGGGGFITITSKLAASMQITNFYNPASPTSIIGGAAQFGASGIAATLGIILTLIGLIVTVFVFGAAMIFLIVRILHLWLLLIFAPIVWMLWILPATSGYFSQWWNTFLRWAFFAPILVFMIYLSLSIFDATGKFKGGVFPAGNSAWNTATPGLTTASMPAAIFQWILVIAMMFGSLIVANKFGIEGAKASQQMLEGWGNSAKNLVGRRLRSGYVGWTKPEEPGAPPQTGVRGFLKKVGTNVGMIAATTPGLRGAQLKAIESERKSYEEAQNKYKNIDPAVLEQMRTIGQSTLEPRELLAIKQILIEKGKYKPHSDELSKILDQARRYSKEDNFLKVVSEKMGKELDTTRGYDTAAITDLIQRAKKYGQDSDFTKFFPEIGAAALGKSVEEMVSKIDKAADIYLNQLTDGVIKALNPAQLKDIGKNGGRAKQSAVENSVQSDFNRLPAADQQSVRNVLSIRNKNRKEEERKQLPENARKLSYAIEIINTPSWEHNI